MPHPLPRPNHHPIRRLNPHRDLNVIANLIEDSFHLQTDPEGQVILRQIRAYAERQRQFPSLTLLPGAPDGFVWEEDERIIGNVSLIQYTYKQRRIFLIANVAVVPEWRRKGIARALTEHVLRYVSQFPRSETWLQVRSDNEPAIHLYESQGFRLTDRLTQWRLPSSLRAAGSGMALAQAGGTFGRRKGKDWQNQSRWLEVNYPSRTRWYQNLNFDSLKPWAWLSPLQWDSVTYLEHFTLRENDSLRGVLTWQQTDLSSDALWLALPETERESVDARTLTGNFLTLRRSPRPLALEYPYGRAIEGLQDIGFCVYRHLDWMRYMRPDP